MSFLELGFSVNGQRGEEYGLYLVSKESTTNQKFGVSSKLIREKIRHRDEPYTMGAEKEIYNMQISMAKIENGNTKFSYEDRVAITKWLKNNDDFVEFCSDDSPQLIYYLHFNSGDFENLGFDEGIVTFDCEMKYPYAMSPISYSNFDLSDNTTSQIIILTNHSNVLDYYYPMIEFKLIGNNTNFKMINHSNGGEVFEFTNLSVGETICVDNLNKRIKSDTSNARLSDFNKKWLKLCYGQNQIEVFGACIIDVKCQFPMAL